MKELHVLQLETISGGDRVTAFCNGFGVAATVYGLGAVANLWNPIGWAGTIGLAAAVIGCAAY
jgi:uncharacterized membrane protein YkgB